MVGQRASQSFIARIWLEREQNGGPIWRGRIRHVQGTQESHFQDLGEMREFLQRVTGVPGPRLTGSQSEDATVSEPSALADEESKI